MKRHMAATRDTVAAKTEKLIKSVRSLSGRIADKVRRHKAAAVITASVLAVSGTALFLMYGPYKGLSDLYITTAMHTSDHRYLAEWFYSDEYIARVLDRNSVQEQYGASEGITPSEISDGIELHRIEKSGFSGWMMIVDDPSRLRVVPAEDSGELLEDIARRYGARAAINASGYVANSDRGEPGGMVIIDHHLVHHCEYDTHSFFALTDSGEMSFGTLSTESILQNNYRDVIDFGPVLILNGVSSRISGYGTGMSARTIIGQTASGEALMLVIDGMQIDSFGATLADAQKIMLEYGAVNAIALDGGSSSSMYCNNEIINTPSQREQGRVLPNAIIVE